MSKLLIERATLEQVLNALAMQPRHVGPDGAEKQTKACDLAIEIVVQALAQPNSELFKGTQRVTRFAVGDRCWYMRDNRVVEAYVSSVHTSFNEDGGHIFYGLSKPHGFQALARTDGVEEKELFASKAELLESL